MKKDKQLVQVDAIAEKLATLGVPAIVFITVSSATGFVGAAATTTALAALGGPLGMLGGLGTLGIIGLFSQAIVKFGAKTLLQAVVKALYEKGETKESITETIKKYKISNSLKSQILQSLDELD